MVTIETSHGLGKHLDTLMADQISVQLKTEYASQFLYIATLYTSQLSLLAFVRDVTPAQHHLRMIYWSTIIVSIWTIVGVFGIAFQCETPEPWDHIDGTCFDRVGSDILTAYL